MKTIGEYFNRNYEHPPIHNEEKCVWPDPSCYVGFEAELENFPLPHGKVNKLLSYFNWKEDGSLRGNYAYELYFPRPLRGYELEKAINVLYDSIAYGELDTPDLTHRMSTQVHIDVRDLTARELMKMVIIFTILENVLFHFTGYARKDNAYCTPVSESASMRYDIGAVFEGTPSEHTIFDRTMNMCDHFCKYSSINLHSVIQRGSVEFRQMPGEINKNKIVNWICVLQKIKQYAKTSDEDFLEIPRNISSMGPSSFVKKVLGEYAEPVLQACPASALSHEFYDSIRKAQDIINFNDIMNAGLATFVHFGPTVKPNSLVGQLAKKMHCSPDTSEESIMRNLEYYVRFALPHSWRMLLKLQEFEEPKLRNYVDDIVSVIEAIDAETPESFEWDPDPDDEEYDEEDNI